MHKRHLCNLMMSILVSVSILLPAVAATTMEGMVIKVIDGDSIRIRQGMEQHEIRLWGIDCPEYNQPYASTSKKLSKSLLNSKNVTVKVKSRDSYGRLVGVVYQGDVNINEELVRRGGAWVYGQYCREDICKKWKQLEKNARIEHQGLWADKNPIAPWKWRRLKK